MKVLRLSNLTILSSADDGRIQSADSPFASSPIDHLTHNSFISKDFPDKIHSSIQSVRCIKPVKVYRSPANIVRTYYLKHAFVPRIIAVKTQQFLFYSDNEQSVSFSFVPVCQASRSRKWKWKWKWRNLSEHNDDERHFATKSIASNDRSDHFIVNDEARRASFDYTSKRDTAGSTRLECVRTIKSVIDGRKAFIRAACGTSPMITVHD